MLVPLLVAAAVAAPPAPRVSAPAIQDSPIAVTISAPRGTKRLTCSVDHAKAKTCVRFATFKANPGKHTVSVRAVNKSGRASAARTVTVIVPARAPAPVNIGSGAQPVGLTAANGRVWVSDGPTGDVTAIDAASKHVVATVHVGGQLGSVLATGDAVWVSVFGGGTVARIDAVHDVVTAQVAVGGRPTGLAIDPSGALWVGNLDGYVSRIDTATGKVTGKVTLPSGASQPLATRGLIWVGLQSGSVVTVDPATSAITGSSISVAQDVDALADTSNGLWVSTFSGTAALLDPTARTVTHRVKLGSSGSGLSFGNGSVWVSGYDSGLVLQLDPATGALLGAVHTGTQPRDSVVVGSVLWVADQGDGAVTPIPI